MTVTITLPAADHHVGPGFGVFGSSDFVGPLPTGSFWELAVSADTSALGDWGWQIRRATTTPDFTCLVGELGTGAPIAPPRVFLAGAAVNFCAELYEPPFTLLDAGHVATVWEPTAQRWWFDWIGMRQPADSTQLSQLVAMLAVSRHNLP